MRFAMLFIVGLFGLGLCGCPQIETTNQTEQTSATQAQSATEAAVSLSSLPGHSAVLHVNRAWTEPQGAAAGGLPTDDLPESDYHAVTDGPAYAVQFSADGQNASVGEPVMQGPRTSSSDQRWQFNLDAGTFAGGRFAVWQGPSGLEAELTIFGSGRPVVKSERGSLELTE